MKEFVQDLRMIVALRLMRTVITILPKNEDGLDIIRAIVAMIKKQIEKK